jgi:hypothetical protein
VKIHNDGTHEWHHKDGRRQYWRIDAKPTGDMRDNGQEEFWEYWIFRDGALLGGGNILHQAALPHPDPHDIFNDWIGQLLSVACGFAQSREEWYGAREEKP